MTSLFKKQRPKERTILLLDIENGSVAAALVRIAPEKQPKLFGETRRHLPAQHTRDGKSLFGRVTVAAREAMRSVSEVAARIRQHPATSDMGRIDAVAVFLSAPWGTPNLELGRPEFMPQIQDFLSKETHQWAGDVPVSFHTSTGSGVFGLRALYPEETNSLLYTLTAEVGELVHIRDGHVQGHATMPFGYHNVLRTLKSHAGISEHEARSAFHLRHLEEPLGAAAEHLAREFALSAHDLINEGDIESVFVLTHEPVAQWAAESLSETELLAELFPEGGTVRAVRSAHVTPHIAAHASSPDLSLMLAALFVDSHAR